jgi:hypothetical protein
MKVHAGHIGQAIEDLLKIFCQCPVETENKHLPVSVLSNKSSTGQKDNSFPGASDTINNTMPFTE